MTEPYSRRYIATGFVLVLSFILVGGCVQANLFDGFDVVVFTSVNSAHSEVVDTIMIVSSLYGREVVWGGLTVMLFVFGGKSEKKTAITLGLVFLVLTGVGYATKEVYSRPRPYDAMGGVRLIVDAEPDESYPSGHTLIVAAGVVVAWMYLRRKWAAVLTLEACLVGYSRMYVGVHYPSDIIGGILLGAGIALIICAYPKIVDRIYGILPTSLQAK